MAWRIPLPLRFLKRNQSPFSRLSIFRILFVCCTHVCWYISGYPVFYIYYKICIILIRRFLYCIRTRILTHVNWLVNCYFYRYLVIVFLLSCISYLYFIWRWLSLCIYSSGVEEIKNGNQSINPTFSLVNFFRTITKDQSWITADFGNSISRKSMLHHNNITQSTKWDKYSQLQKYELILDRLWDMV